MSINLFESLGQSLDITVILGQECKVRLTKKLVSTCSATKEYSTKCEISFFVLCNQGLFNRTRYFETCHRFSKVHKYNESYPPLYFLEGTGTALHVYFLS